MVYRGQSLNGPYPVDIISVPITTISTFVLLMSSFGMVTAALGAVFIGFQIYEFNAFKNEGLTLGVNLFGASFFTLTGFHGAHVTVGIIWLLGLYVAARRGRIGPATSLDVEIMGLYWHFVDIVWIVIFTLLYLIGGFDAGPTVLPGGGG